MFICYNWWIFSPSSTLYFPYRQYEKLKRKQKKTEEFLNRRRSKQIKKDNEKQRKEKEEYEKTH